jgi:hypothetical protein
MKCSIFILYWKTKKNNSYKYKIYIKIHFKKLKKNIHVYVGYKKIYMRINIYKLILYIFFEVIKKNKKIN